MKDRPDLFSTCVAGGGSESREGLHFEISGPGFHLSGHRSPETIRSCGSTRRFRGEIPPLIPKSPPDLQILFEF